MLWLMTTATESTGRKNLNRARGIPIDPDPLLPAWMTTWTPLKGQAVCAHTEGQTQVSGCLPQPQSMLPWTSLCS